MLNLNGRNFSTNNCAITGDSTKVASASVGGRTALTSSATSETISLDYRDWEVWRSCGPLAFTTDAVKTALLIDAWVCFPTLSLASGAAQNVLGTKIWNGASASGNNYCYLYLMVYYDGAAYTLQLKRVSATATDYVVLDTITAGTTYHRYTLYIFKDKVYTSKDMAAFTETAFTGSTMEGTLFPGKVTLGFFGGSVIAAWDALRVEPEEYDPATTAAVSRTNGNPDNGELVIIEKTALEGLITAGTAYALSVANGAFTEAATADKNYLIAKVLSDNDGGFAIKANKSAGGVWTPSNWSFA